MRKPLGIIFDFGDTVLRGEFNFVTGNKRILELSENAFPLTAEDIQLVADELSKEIQGIRDESMIEFGVQSFQRLLYETLGISSNVSYPELEREFWHAAVTYTPLFNLLVAVKPYWWIYLLDEIIVVSVIISVLLTDNIDYLSIDIFSRDD